jgi:gluconokinase
MPAHLKSNDQNLTCVVMGVSGCGKSTLARALAETTGGIFLEGDDFHSPAHKAKMAAGTPLTDEDRWPWYDRMIGAVQAARETGGIVFLSCSALKKVYRDHLRAALPGCSFIYLKGDVETIQKRLQKRADHFMPLSLLQTQFATLEEPQTALTLDIAIPLNQMVQRVRTVLELETRVVP